MVETMMALWNWGVSGRLIVMAVTFFCTCISISLLFVTVGSAWGSLFAHGRPGGGETHMVDSVLITVTAPTFVATEVATSPVEATPAITPNPCLASPTGSHGYTPQVDVTRSSGRSSDPTARATVTPAHRQKTATPGVTVTPEPSPTPSPTLPAVTPTVTVTPTAISTPTVTVTNTPTVGITPTDTSTPGATPPVTPAVTPAVTPVVTPTSVPTIGIVPTVTATPNVTPTVTAPASSPTVMTSVTPGIGSRNGHGGGPLTPGTPSSGNNNQPGQGNCLSDNLATSGEGAVLSLLQNFLWIILVSSLLGTALFCAQMCRITRRRAGR